MRNDELAGVFICKKKKVVFRPKYEIEKLLDVIYEVIQVFNNGAEQTDNITMV